MKDAGGAILNVALPSLQDEFDASSSTLQWIDRFGLGASLIMPATLSIITNVFPREERGKAIGIWAEAMGIGFLVAGAVAVAAAVVVKLRLPARHVPHEAAGWRLEPVPE